MSESVKAIEPLEIIECYCEAAKRVLPRGHKVFTDSLVIFLMVLQFLRNCSMERVLLDMQTPALRVLSGLCKRTVKGHKFSENNSGYWNAWNKVEEEKILTLLYHLHLIIRGKSSQAKERLCVVIDGTTVELPPTAKLRAKYPPKPKSNSVFPQILILNAHELNTGCVMTVEFGAQNGPNAENEVNLMHKIVSRIEAGSILIADRFHGMHSVVLAANTSHHDVILRMTDPRIDSLFKRAEIINKGFIDERFIWTRSKFEKRKHHNDEDGPVEVRLIAVDMLKENKPFRLYLVTSLLEMSAEEIIQLYARRWEIETDLKNIKQSTNMKALTSKSPELIRKEFLAGLITYNLVRSVMMIAADKYNKDPKRLSYLYSLDAVKMYLPIIARTESPTKRLEHYEELLRLISRKVNKLRNRKNAPRVAYRRSSKYDIHPTQGTHLEKN